MNSRTSGIMWLVVIILFVIILVLGYMLVRTPAPATGAQATSTVSTSTSTGTDTNTDTTTGTSAMGITVTAPQSGSTVPKTFTVTGSAAGSWYFEASFPVEVRDPSGTVVGTGHATALSDWMTTAQVPFKADITVASYTGPATLVLKKDNPSGDPQRDASVTVAITIQ